MEIKILFDNKALSEEFSSGFGFSCLVDGRILFDTGEEGKRLLHNIETMKVKVSKIEAAVISHDHWDHTGGLWDLLKTRKGLYVYACPRFSSKFKQQVKDLGGQLVETGGFTEVARDIFATGEIAGEYKGGYMAEQALAVKTNKGMSVITGCAHPGIVNMVQGVKERFPREKIYSVFGGFHLSYADQGTVESIVGKFKEMDVQKAGPTHCTGPDAEEIFKKGYGQDFLSLAAGKVFKI